LTQSAAYGNLTDSVAPVLVYDDVCVLCNWAVRLVLRHGRGTRIRFAPQGGAFATTLVKTHPELASIDSVIFVVPGAGEHTEPRVFVRSDAVLALAATFGGAWRILEMSRLLPRRVRDAAYDLVARNRYRVFGRHDSCPVPDPDVRSRFIP
jgi:predicted DCC family thiol-disulfide oxidoreductase YuxK